MKKTVRNYQGTDAYMAEAARTIHNLLVQDLADFTAVNTRFTQEFADNFLAQITAADEVITDYAVLAEQGVDTAQVLTAMQRARKLYSRIKHHATWAFGNSPATIKQFSTGYRDASRKQAQMIVFLETLANVVEQHKEALTDPALGGMPNDLPGEITALRQELQSRNTIQEVRKKDRPLLTEQRINTLNACYRAMLAVNNTAQIVYNEQPAKRSQYTYRPTTGSNESTEYTGTVAAAQTTVIATLTYRATRFISFENRGLVPLQFDLSLDNNTLEGNLIDLGGGANVSQQMDWLIDGVEEDTEVQLLVRNLSDTQEGSYWVSVNME